MGGPLASAFGPHTEAAVAHICPPSSEEASHVFRATAAAFRDFFEAFLPRKLCAFTYAVVHDTNINTAELRRHGDDSLHALKLRTCIQKGAWT